MFGLNPEQDFCIRVDSPTDVIIQLSLNQTDASKTTEQLIEEGNKAFLAQKFHQAIHSYSNAIYKSNKKSPRAFLNRSQCFLKLEKFNAAYQDANEAIKLDTQNEKAYFRMGKSAYGLRKFELALVFYVHEHLHMKLVN
jgi:tetratricopeptide (TPR) repeat protein